MYTVNEVVSRKMARIFLCSFFYCLMILVYDDVIKYFFAAPSIFFLNLDLI